MENIFVVRHFEDEEKLLSHGFNPPLKEGQENLTEDIANRLLIESINLGKKKINFISSRQLRTIETTQLLQQKILNENKKIEVFANFDDRLSDLDQGKPIFPVGYMDGDLLPCLPLAWSAFWEQSFERDNLLYHFGDSINQENISVYPGLDDKFENFGECYAEFAYRLFDFVGSLQLLRDNNAVNVIVGHTATISIMHELVELSNDLNKLSYPEISVGSLSKIIWSYFDKIKHRIPIKLPHGYIDHYQIDNLLKPEIQELMQNEKIVLKRLLLKK